MPDNSINIRFILVEPKYPENVGAAARAMKTMGFKNLIIVGNEHHRSEVAARLAHGSTEILDSALVYPELGDAVKDFDLIIGTTARRRAKFQKYYPATNLVEIISSKHDSLQNVAIVFGREDTGLTNREMDCCDMLSSLPLKVTYPSLNLGQAVMLYAYTLSPLLDLNAKQPLKNADAGMFNNFKVKINEVLSLIGIKPNSEYHARLHERIGAMKQRDLNLFRFD